jgi:hypothetical protein
MSIRVLDLDLDFFVSPIANFISGKQRLNDDEYSVDQIDSIAQFLETQCGLTAVNRLPAKLFEEHDQVFDYLRMLKADPWREQQVDLHHIDAHSDTGGGLTSCWHYVFSEYLHLPLSARMFPRRGAAGLNPGNFIIFLAACGWLDRVRFVTHPQWQDDIQHVYMHNFDSFSGAIQLKKYNPQTLRDAPITKPLDKIEHELEPAIPFEIIGRENYSADGPFDFVFLTRSPGFTPRFADTIFDWIKINYLRV